MDSSSSQYLTIPYEGWSAQSYGGCHGVKFCLVPGLRIVGLVLIGKWNEVKSQSCSTDQPESLLYFTKDAVVIHATILYAVI